MRIAVTSQGPDLDSAFDQRFGRCPYVVVVETDTMSAEALPNPHAEETGGAGTRLASLLARRAVGAVVTGQPGPHAEDALRAAGIPALLAHAGTVREAVQQHQATQAAETGAPAKPAADQIVETSALVAEGGRRRRRQRRRRRRRCRGGGSRVG